MATEKMTMITLSGPMEQVDEAIRFFVINHDFHPENAVAAMKNVMRLTPFDAINDYAEPLAEAYSLADELGIAPEYRDFSEEGYTRQDVSGWFSDIRSRLEGIKSEIAETEKSNTEKTEVIERLLHIGDVEEKLSDLLNMKYSKFRFGRIPADYYEGCMKLVKKRDDVFFVRTGEDDGDDGMVYGMYFVLPKSAEHVDSIFTTQQFERIYLDRSLVGTASETKKALADEVENGRKYIESLKAEREGLSHELREEFLRRYSFVRFMSECYSLRSLAGYRSDSFYIVGWIPKDKEEEFTRSIEEVAASYGSGEEGAGTMVFWAPSGNLEGVVWEKASRSEYSCILSDGSKSGVKPPVKLKNGFLSKIYSPFVEMYGLPGYGEIDPRAFMAITYTLLFGIMYGDIGQGVVLCLFGLLLWKLKKLWLGRILALCGVASTIFGFVYGSVFGYEELLPGYKVLEGENTMKILIIAVAVGVVLLLTCMVLNMINGLRQRDYGKVLFSPNGLAGFIMYLSLAAGVVVMFAFGKNIFSAAYIICLIILPLFCIFAQGPLSKLISGDRNWMPSSIGMFIVEGFFELFETILSYASNTISFLRVGAFAISHAGMMMVVMMLSSDGKNIFGVIIGNIVVMGIEGMLVCIQVLRLEFYEMFGRFYTSGGERFAPRIIDYTKKA